MILRDRLKFVLVAPSRAGNIGSAARAMKVMGFHRLAVVSPREVNPGQHPEAIAFASRATDILEHLEIYGSLDEALADSQLNIAVSAECREFGPLAMTPEALASRLSLEFEEVFEKAIEGRPDGKIGTRVGQDDTGVHLPGALLPDSLVVAAPATISLIFGTERTGLSIETVQRCQWLCAIPTAGEYNSLNLSQAVQVLAYVLGREQQMLNLPEPVRQSRTSTASAGQTVESWATDPSIEGLFGHLERTLVKVGFLDPEQPKKLMPRLRRIFARSRLTNKEVDILRGICGQIDVAQNKAKVVRSMETKS